MECLAEGMSLFSNSIGRISCLVKERLRKVIVEDDGCSFGKMKCYSRASYKSTDVIDAEASSMNKGSHSTPMRCSIARPMTVLYELSQTSSAHLP